MALTKKEIEEYTQLYGAPPPASMMGNATGKKKSLLNEKEAEEYRALYNSEPPSVEDTTYEAPKQKTPDKKSKTFSKEDPKIIGDTLKEIFYGIIPGSREAVRQATGPTRPIGKTLEDAVTKIPVEAGKDIWNMVRGFAGIPIRTAMTADDLQEQATGKSFLPSTAEVPILGAQQSAFETRKQLKEQGAGEVVSTGIPALQTLFDLLLGKTAISKGKGLLKTGKSSAQPIEAPIAKPTGPKLLAPEAESLAAKKQPIELPPSSDQLTQFVQGEQLPARQPVQSVPAPQIPGDAGRIPMEQMTMELLNEALGKSVSTKDLTMELLTDLLSKKGKENVKGQYYDQILPDTPENIPLKPQSKAPPQVLPKYRREQPNVIEEKIEIPPDSGKRLARFLKGEPVEDAPSAQKTPAKTAPALADDSMMESPTVSPVQSLKNMFTRNNPFSFESQKVETYGEPGKQLVTRTRRAYAKSIGAKQTFRELNSQVDFDSLTPDEWLNVRNVIEGKGTPVNDKVIKAAEVYKTMFDEWAGKTETDRIQNYFPRKLNEQGIKEMAKLSENSEVVKTIAKERNISPSDALELVRGSVRRGSFEHKRVLPTLPEKWRADPKTELLSWQENVARRYGVISELGKDTITFEGKQLPIEAKRLIDQMVASGKSTKEQGAIKDLATSYVDKIVGRTGDYTDIPNVLKALKSSMVVSKLNPMTTAANELQGYVNSWLQYGEKGLIDSMRKGGDKLAKDTGLIGMKSKIFDEYSAGAVAEKWMKAIGMEGSEIRGFKRSARSTYGAINRAWDALKKNPNDVKAKTLLQKHAMFVDEGELQKALKSGVLPEDELKIGVIEGTRQKMHFFAPGERPGWASTPTGSVAYMFHNYLLSQLKLLGEAPRSRQLAYLAVVAPLTGIPILTLRRVIQGKALPQTPEEWFIEGSASGPGTPFDIAKTTETPEFLLNYLLGGYSPVAETVTSNNKVKTAVRNFVPGGSLLSNWIFPNE